MQIKQFEPYLGNDEKTKLCECVDDNWITGGKKVKEFERRLADLVGVDYSIACMNGSCALLMGLKALGICQGDEVLVPDFTFAASAFAVNWAGGTPVFVDVDRESFNIDINDCKKKLTERTRAIMPVHIYGQSADMQAVLEFALENRLSVIEDAAQGIGVIFGGHYVGGLSDVGIMSFYGDKTITTSEGGMVFTNKLEIATKINRINNQGRDGRGWYIHDEIGLNFRMTDLQAGVGLAQLDKLDTIIKTKKKHELLYKSLLENVKGIKIPQIDIRCFNVPFRHNILLDNPQGLMDYLKTNGVGSTRFFYPLHMQPCYNQKGDFPNSMYAYEHGLSLPSSVSLTDDQINYVCDLIRGYSN